MRNSQFIPWLGQLVAGLATVIGGLELARMSWGSSWDVVGFGFVVVACGLGVIVRAELQERPLRVLRKARRSLTFPTQWSVRFNKRVPQGGVLPVAVIRSDGVRFVIDIQDHKAVAWNAQYNSSSDLVGANGKPFRHDPVGPLLQAAEAWGATAVLWLPEATTVRNLRKEGVNLIVVMGPSRELKNALRGAEIVPLREHLEAASVKRRKVRDGGVPLTSPGALA